MSLLVSLDSLLPYPNKISKGSILELLLRLYIPKGYRSDKAKNQLSCDKHHSLVFFFFLSEEGGVRRIREIKLNCFAHKYLCVCLVCYKRDCLWAVLCASCLGNCVLLLLFFYPFPPLFMNYCSLYDPALGCVCVMVSFIYLFACLASSFYLIQPFRMRRRCNGNHCV